MEPNESQIEAVSSICRQYATAAQKLRDLSDQRSALRDRTTEEQHIDRRYGGDPQGHITREIEQAREEVSRLFLAADTAAREAWAHPRSIVTDIGERTPGPALNSSGWPIYGPFVSTEHGRRSRDGGRETAVIAWAINPDCPTGFDHLNRDSWHAAHEWIIPWPERRDPERRNKLGGLGAYVPEEPDQNKVSAAREAARTYLCVNPLGHQPQQLLGLIGREITRADQERAALAARRTIAIKSLAGAGVSHQKLADYMDGSLSRQMVSRIVAQDGG